MSAELLTVGQSVPPIYGIEKATGALRFPADINLPNMLWMKILRSPHAHARIVAVDATAAEKISGVAAVITHKDVPHVLFGPYQNEIYPLDEEIRFVGDTVAAVRREIGMSPKKPFERFASPTRFARGPRSRIRSATGRARGGTPLS